MSWSFRAIGTPENLSRALDAEAEKLDGDSRAEFEAAKPHLQGLLAMNVNQQGPSTLQLEASGHAYKKDGHTMMATEPGGLRLLPPAPHLCQVCARDHTPTDPHDATTLFYRVQFRGRFGRDGTWADAIAHCDDETREVWKTQLQRIGAYTEPAAGEEPIDQPHRYGMAKEVARGQS